jgi:hypothetical protein
MQATAGIGNGQVGEVEVKIKDMVKANYGRSINIYEC